MYRRVYRQEGGGLGSGLSELNAQAFMRKYVDNYVQDYNRRNQGEVAAKVMPRPVPRSIPQRGSSGLMAIPQAINNLKNKNISDILNIEKITGVDKVNKLASDFYDSTKGDEANLARHAAASRELANRLTPDIPGGKYIGNVLSFGGGVAEELSDLGQRGMSYFPAALEDIKANITGLNYPSGTTPAEIYKDVYGTNNPQDDYGGVQEAIQNQEQPTVNPLDYQNEFNFRRNYLSDYIDSSQDKFGDEGKLSSYAFIPEVSPMYNATQETGLSYDPQRYSEYQKASDAADRAWGYRYNPEQNTTVTTQPTGFQNQQQGLPSLMKIVNEQRNPTPVTPSNATGFNSKADAMADLRSKYSNVGLVAMPTQNADGSWSYQPPYNLDSPPPKPLGLLNPGMAL